MSIEVSPELANDTERTIAMARDLWRRCARPNVLVKIPATTAGLPAIREALGEGINVNVTLTFSVRRYREVAEAFLAGVEDRHARGLSLDGLTSVASFFVSRVDTKVDGILRDRLQQTEAREDRRVLEALIGRSGIANSKLAFHQFRQIHSGSRWERLTAAGARPQRCLWASTSVKDPSFPPTMYVEALAGPDTVDTMPLATFRALAEARVVGPQLEQRTTRCAGCRTWESTSRTWARSWSGRASNPSASPTDTRSARSRERCRSEARLAPNSGWFSAPARAARPGYCGPTAAARPGERG